MGEFSTYLLRTVPGLPPILQTVHLLGLAMLMASVIMINLRLLGAAGRGQQLQEMMQRLFPWFYAALPVLLLSGLPFLLARPQRYLNNPVFIIKAWSLLLALLLTLLLWTWYRGGKAQLQGVAVRILALTCLLSWLLTALAGRWVAYADYLFWPG